MRFEYHVNIQAEGGADVNFQHVADEEIAAGDVITNDAGRRFIVLSARETKETHGSDDETRFGMIDARAAE